MRMLFTQPVGPQSFAVPPIMNETVRKCVTSVVEIFQKMHANDDPAAFQAAVSAVSTLGSAARQDSLSTHNAIGLLVGVVSLTKKLSQKASRQPLLDALRLEYAHLRRDAREDTDKRTGMALCLVEIIKLCIEDQVPGIVDSLLASSQGILETNNLPKSVAVTLKFFISKHLLFLDEFESAKTELLIANKSMLARHKSQTENVLLLLIPLQLSQGLFPDRKLLHRFPRLKSAYLPLLRAVKNGDIFNAKKIMKNLKMEETFFVLTRKIELVICRSLVKKVFQESEGKRRIDLGVIKSVFEFSAQKTMDIFIAEEIVANLVLQGMMTGYLSYEEQALMLTGANPFPV